MADLETAMPGRHPPLFLWAPSRLVRELLPMCLPELELQYASVVKAASGDSAAPAAVQAPPPLAVSPLVGGGMTARLTCPPEQHPAVLPLVVEAARKCTLLTAAIQPLAAAAMLEAAAAAAAQQLAPGTAAHHPLRVLSIGTAARGPIERFMRRRLQQLGLGTQPVADQPPLWCIQRQQAEGPQTGEEKQHDQGLAGGAALLAEPVLIGLELAAGAPATSAAAAAAMRQLGPTAMQPELAALSASLAAVQPGSTVLDPFCGTGSLLLAAVQRGAALALGCDVDATHFGPGACSTAGDSGGPQGIVVSGGVAGGSASSASQHGTSDDNSGGRCQQEGGSGCVLMHADAAALRKLLPAASVDAVVTDMPYGYRTTVAVEGSEAGSMAAVEPGSTGSCEGDHGSAAAQAVSQAAQAAGEAAEEWQGLLGLLLRLSAHVLVPGGRLLAWMPCQEYEEGTGSQQRQLAEEGAAHSLCLLHFLPESRQGGYPRAIALFQREERGDEEEADESPHSSSSSSSSRQAALLAAVQAAAGSGVPVYQLPSPHAEHGRDATPAQQGQQAEQAGERQGEEGPAEGGSTPAAVQWRGMKYSQQRGAAVGADIDVWRAAWLGDASAIREYAAGGGDLNAGDRKRQTPLQFAAGYGREAAVQALLELGADPGLAADASGMAALHRAAARNHTAVLLRLLAGGADPWQRSAAGQTPLMYASQFGHEAPVASLLQHVAGGGGGPHAEHAERQQQQQVEQQGSEKGSAGGSRTGGCVASSGGGSSSTLRRHLSLHDAGGRTALHLAAQWGVACVAEQLLAAGADPNQRSACDRQLAPAHLAARWGHPGVLGALRRHAGDLGAACGGRGWTPLQEAQEWRRPACVTLLQDGGGETGLPSGVGQPA